MPKKRVCLGGSGRATKVVEIQSNKLVELTRLLTEQTEPMEFAKRALYAIAVGLSHHFHEVLDCHDGIGKLPRSVRKNFKDAPEVGVFCSVTFQNNSQVVLYRGVSKHLYCASIQNSRSAIIYKTYSERECESLVNDMLKKNVLTEDQFQLLHLRIITCSTRSLASLYREFSSRGDSHALTILAAEIRKRWIVLINSSLHNDSRAAKIYLEDRIKNPLRTTRSSAMINSIKEWIVGKLTMRVIKIEKQNLFALSYILLLKNRSFIPRDPEVVLHEFMRLDRIVHHSHLLHF